MKINAPPSDTRRGSLPYNRVEPAHYDRLKQSPCFELQQQHFSPHRLETNGLHALGSERNRVLSSTNKENKLRGSKGAGQYGKTNDEVMRLMQQNEWLRQQLGRQQELQQQKVSKLMRNIKQKDELLDECEQEINKLRHHYQKMLTQRQPPTVSRNASLHKLDSRTSNPETTHNSTPNTVIPLSLISKAANVARPQFSSTAKLSHGLMRR